MVIAKEILSGFIIAIVIAAIVLIVETFTGTYKKVRYACDHVSRDPTHLIVNLMVIDPKLQISSGYTLL